MACADGGGGGISGEEGKVGGYEREGRGGGEMAGRCEVVHV